MKTLTRLLQGLVLVMLASTSIAGYATEKSGVVDKVLDWQLKALFTPYKGQRKSELTKGTVYIYQYMTDKTVELAMDKQFDRIENMMFIGVIVTDEMGEPVIDEETGKTIKEDDDC